MWLQIWGFEASSVRLKITLFFPHLWSDTWTSRIFQSYLILLSKTDCLFPHIERNLLRDGTLKKKKKSKHKTFFRFPFFPLKCTSSSVLKFSLIFFIYFRLCLAFVVLCGLFLASCGKQGLLFLAVCGLLIMVASLVAEHGIQAQGGQ